MSTESRSPKNWSTSAKYGAGCAVFATLLVATSATLANAGSDSPTGRAPTSATRTDSATRTTGIVGPCFMTPKDWNAATDGPIPTCLR